MAQQWNAITRFTNSQVDLLFFYPLVIAQSQPSTAKIAMSKDDQPALGIPYPYQANPQPPMQGPHPHQDGLIPPNAVFGDPKGIPLQQTMFKDTPAPFNCVYCGSSGLTDVSCVLRFADLESMGVQETISVGDLRGFSSRVEPMEMAVDRTTVDNQLCKVLLSKLLDDLEQQKPLLSSHVEEIALHARHAIQTVAEFEKSDICIVMDPPRWTEESFAARKNYGPPLGTKKSRSSMKGKSQSAWPRLLAYNRHTSSQSGFLTRHGVTRVCSILVGAQSPLDLRERSKLWKIDLGRCSLKSENLGR
ncbi:hypothetical protein ACLOJK_002187 [Asimina triloba]